MTTIEPGPTHHLWLDPSFGASGDMMLGALVDLGASLETIRNALNRLDIAGWQLTEERVTRCGLSATKVSVKLDSDDHHHRPWSAIDNMLSGADLDASVSTGARRTFRRLGDVEAEMHNTTLDEVHFHEVGAIDAIVDIVGSWVALTELKSKFSVEQITTGPVGLGSGTVKAAHGHLPLPAPATAALLKGFPIRSVSVESETCTPTGAALLTTMASAPSPIPSGLLVASARGAGGRDPAQYPNVITAHLVQMDQPNRSQSEAPTKNI